MEVIKEGYIYSLHNRDGEQQQLIRFYETERVAETSSLRTVAEGVTDEELLAVAEHRALYLNRTFYPSRESSLYITKLQEARMWLEERSRDRIARNVKGIYAR